MVNPVLITSPSPPELCQCPTRNAAKNHVVRCKEKDAQGLVPSVVHWPECFPASPGCTSQNLAAACLLFGLPLILQVSL